MRYSENFQGLFSCQTQVSIWLGDHALEEGLREGLLSLPKEEKEN